MKYFIIFFIGLLFWGCSFPHRFQEDPEGYGAYERCGTCGDTYQEGWHTSYQENDPDGLIEHLEHQTEASSKDRSD
ncbi:MAG: hypothetical protein AABZ60_15995 [Planctomycetota bacterium]